MQEIDIIIKILLASGLGALIGLERELDDEPAGIRTHILVAMGSAIFTMLSFAVSSGDPTRIASNIVVGIGFLGAGTIFKDKYQVRGLTTAADIWVVSAIGMAVGLGDFFLATISALLIFFVLVLKKIFFPKRKGKVLRV